jgi:hypothetical protein
MVARTAPAILELLGDGISRPRNAIITALADRHSKEDVVRTLMRLAVTGQLVETGRKYSLAPIPSLVLMRRLREPREKGSDRVSTVTLHHGTPQSGQLSHFRFLPRQDLGGADRQLLVPPAPELVGVDAVLLGDRLQ